MPELPDILVYLERLKHFVVGRKLEALEILHPFLVRSYDPPIATVEGLKIIGTERLGKRLVLCFEDDLFLVIHLMIAGRLRWKKVGAKAPGRMGVALFRFEHGTLVFTEASKKRRASMHLERTEAAMRAHDRGGLQVLQSDPKAFETALKAKNHTLKRALTDPRILSGIGNAYSDEILFAARLSPFKQTKHLGDEEIGRLHEATLEVLTAFTDQLRAEVGDGFPDKVTAFRGDMFVHGRYREPCKVCGMKIMRVRYADNEMNYCPECQTEGRLLADRGLSRLLKKDWPKTLDELDRLVDRHKG